MTTSDKERGVLVISCEYPPFPGGIATYAQGVVGALRDHGVKVRVIAPAYGEFGADQSDRDCLRLLGHHSIPAKAVPAILREISRLPKDDIILAADIRTAIFLYMTHPFHRRAYRVMAHGSEASKLQKNAVMAGVISRAYLKADAILYNSQATQALLEEALRAPCRGIVSYLGVEPGWFEPADGPFDHAALSQLDPAARLVCSVGRIEARKGQLEGVRIMAKIREAHGISDLTYVIVGRPEEAALADAIAAEAQRLSVPVILPGRLDEADLKRLYRRSLCHLLFARALPGKIEGFGLVLLEAAAQGCPSVSTRVGGIPEVVGDAGLLVPEDDLDGAAQAIARLASDAAFRDQLGAAAKDRAHGFTWSACARASFPELFT